MTKQEVLNLIGEFSWNFGQEFFIETDRGNFVYSDPEYGGDNTLRPFNGDLKQYLKETNADYVRDKGVHRIGDYCGKGVIFGDEVDVRDII